MLLVNAIYIPAHLAQLEVPPATRGRRLILVDCSEVDPLEFPLLGFVVYQLALVET